MRRALAVLASLGLAAGTIALATPAHAATYSFSPDCTVVAPSVNQTAVSGDSIQFSGMTGKGCITLRISTEIVASAGSVTVNTTAGTVNQTGGTGDFLWTVTGGEFTSVTVPLSFSGSNSGPIVFQDSTAPPYAGDFTLDVSSGGGGNSDSSGGSAPASVIQQFGLPASGNCEDGYSDSMDWSGVGSGGWGISWAQWMNDGSGGVVCSRTVMYDTSTAKWTVN